MPRRSGGRQGIPFQRGNGPTASFHQDKILKYADGQIFDVITNGVGLMAGYRWPIAPADRGAIIGDVRELERKRSESAQRAPAPPPPQSGSGEVSPERAGQTRAKAEGGKREAP